MDWEKDRRPVRPIIKANAWTEKGARTLSLTSLPPSIFPFFTQRLSRKISPKKRMLISGPEFLFVHMRISPISGAGGEKCNILFCKYFYHSLREFVKMWSLDIWKNGDGFKIIAMDRFHWKECYSREPNVNYSVLLQSTRRPNRILVLMCFCSLSSATFSSEVQFQ